LLRKAYELHKCDECVHLCSENSLTANNTFLLFKAYNTGSSAYSGLTVPSDEMLSYVNKLEDVFISFFDKLEKSKGIGRDLLELLGKIELDIPCKEFNRVFLIRLFVRMRIYYCLKYVNRELVTFSHKLLAGVLQIRSVVNLEPFNYTCKMFIFSVLQLHVHFLKIDSDRAVYISIHFHRYIRHIIRLLTVFQRITLHILL